MRNLFLGAVTLSMSFSALALTMPTCKIANLKDAEKCMERVAKAYPEYESENEAMASSRKDILKKVMNAIGAPRLAAQVDKADYVGAMLEHGDEHHVYYFLMKKGTSKPVELYDLNLVDLAYELERPVTVKDIFLGTNFDGSDVKEDIEYAILESQETH